MIKPRHKILFTLLMLTAIIHTAGLGAEYWQQFVHYQINARLDPDNHLIEGSEILLYQNNSPDTLTELYFHLYPDAFQKNSVMVQEAKAADIEIIRSPEHIGWIEIDSLIITSTHSNQEISSAIFFDDTILKIALSLQLFPGEQLSISMKFATHIRKFNPAGGKGGYNNNLYEVSQWYPKICVYDEKGWHPDKYHWLGEFYGEFGIFDVTLDVPDSFIIAATGTVISGDPGWKSVEIDSNGNFVLPNSYPQSSQPNNKLSSRRIVTFHAENVHDFVWTASPDYLYQTANWQNIPIHILFKKSSQKQWHNNALKNAKNALQWLHDLVGEFPYPQLTVCEGVLPGGMEYPMVIILGHIDLTLMVHEIAHNYFYGAVANNELEEGWLDEGLVTYISEFLVEKNGLNMNSKAAPSLPIKNKFLKKQFGLSKTKDIKLNSLYYYFYSGFEQPLSTKSYELKNLYLYSYNVYLKPSKIFAMLEYLVGQQTFRKTLQTYYERWKFKHADSERFKAVCEQVSGEDLNWFFDQWIKNKTRVDYAGTDLITEQQGNGDWKTDIIIKRLSDGIMPVEIQIVTESGDTIRKRWQGTDRETTISFLTHSKVKNFQLDPDDIILDQNRFNNSKPQFRHFCYPEFISMYYLPRDAYSMFWWPQLWYNDRDGLKIGAKFSGGYLNRYYIIRSSLWYGVKSHQVDFNFGYSMPYERISRNLWQHLYLSKVEGRVEINANLSYILSKQFASMQADQFGIGFLHQHVYNDHYTYRKINAGGEIVQIQCWDKGNINKFNFSFHSNGLKWLPQGSFEFKSQLANKAWGSDFDFIKFYLINHFTMGSVERNWKVNVRTFLGYVNQASDRLPIQDLFWVAEGNPSQQLNYYYLRSLGSLPAWINYHFLGDGNLRGYLNKLVSGNSPLAANKLVTTNIDFVHRKFHYLLPQKIRGFLQGIDFTLFFDAGRVWVDGLDNKYLCDAGLGLRFYKIILGKQRMLRVDFPLWLSQPELDKFSPPESHWKFRWIISLQ